MTFLAYELARQLPLDLARALLYTRVAAGEVTRAVWRCDLVSGGMGGSGQGQHESVAAVQAAAAAVTTRLVVRTGLTERRGRPWRTTRACR